MESKSAHSVAALSAVELEITKAQASNDSPSEAVVTEVRTRISKPLQELRQSSEEIDGLIQAIKVLEDEYHVLNKSLVDYETIRSPIRRLPPDILHEIFHHCLSTHRNPIMSGIEAPLLLTRVCRAWRSVTQSSPRLWARVHIPIYYPWKRGGDTGWTDWSNSPWESDDDQDVAREDAKSAVLARSKLLHDWLSRSGTVPLSISLSYFGSALQGEWSDENPVKQFLTTLLAFSPTISDLELSMAFKVYHLFFSEISPSSLPVLRRLRVNLSGRPTGDSSISLLKAPRLENLSIKTKTDTLFSSPWDTLSMLENLTSLSIHYSITSSAATTVLRRCRQLRYCKLSIANKFEEPLVKLEERIVLPRLIFLILSVSVTTGGLEEIYKHIYAPHLTRFSYQEFVWTFGSTPPDDVRASRPPSGVHYLLENCRSLSKLSIDASVTSPENILACLRSCSQITHLAIGQQYKDSDRPRDHEIWDPDQLNFDLNLLSLQQELAETSANLEEILLPKLEVFEGYLLPNKITDEVVKTFILGRLGDAAERCGVSSLKKVKMTFERVQSMDVESGVQDVAKEQGVAISLDLQYHPPYSIAADAAYSPQHGLDYARSWNGLGL